MNNSRDVKIMGVSIPASKQVWCSLTYIKGIGRTLAMKVCAKSGIDHTKRSHALDSSEIEAIRSAIIDEKILIEGDLAREVSSNIKRLRTIKCYRGSRHAEGLPVRGQRSKTNARTRKGKNKGIKAPSKVTKK